MARVAIFVTCLVDQLFPQVGLAMAEVLQRIGYTIDFPEAQTCCGQPAFNSGFREEAAEVARHFCRVFGESEYVVVPSGSCTSMITHHFSEVMDEKLRPKVYEFSEFLLDVAKVEEVGAKWDGAVTYHDSCHALRELHIKQGPRRLLSRVKGLELREMDIAEECCGFGGTFAIKFEHVSKAMAATKVEAIRRTGAATVVSIDSSCLMQLSTALQLEKVPVATRHLAEILASR